MKLIHVVFALLLVVAGITIFVLTSEPPLNAAGIASDSIKGVSLGGDGAERLSTIGDAPLYFQIAVILLAVCLLMMGVNPKRRDTLFKGLMAGAGAFALFAWIMLYTSYQDYLATGQTDIVAGFPVPTNWFFWGIWGSFVVFNMIYVVFFNRYFLHPDDEKAFQDLVAELKTEKGDA
ncbi:hypothetical protein KFE96_04430 [Kordiimonas sp. SCSIO 12603]|uniref:hypothetical protein n=1 Tax=Kordiimonas sp. SCSIO 12603 TaxID=2829596 RepID=UPI002107986D|nr:hypothetical protein [Kordiimonas sp. SCSIO 12603]UTW59559.1 hypothetical protein KFE96_04430 [Kordiimonas sp. SCSIO 12603]